MLQGLLELLLSRSSRQLTTGSQYQWKHQNNTLDSKLGMGSQLNSTL